MTFIEYYTNRRKLDIEDKGQEMVSVKLLATTITKLLLRPVTSNKPAGDQIYSKKYIRKKEKTPTVYLLPELCDIEAISWPYLEQAAHFPAILHRLENYLLAEEISDKVVDYIKEKGDNGSHCFINDEPLVFTGDETLDSFLSPSPKTKRMVKTTKILEALTCAATQEGFSYERLEMLGDAFLKFIISSHVYFEYPLKHEGGLTTLKDKNISNRNLTRLATEKQVQGYMSVEMLTAKWVPAGFYFETLDNKVRNKTLADVVEALLGTFYMEGSMPLALDFASWIGMPTSWADYRRNHSKSLESKTQLPPKYTQKFKDLEKQLGYNFRNIDLLLEACTHASYTSAYTYCYQRLEFLGDAVLDFLVAKHLFKTFPKAQPGRLTEMKHFIASNEIFGLLAFEYGFHKYLQYYSSSLGDDILNLSKTMKQKEVDIEAPDLAARIMPKLDVYELEIPKVLGDLWESIAGAIFMDSGLNIKALWKVYKPLMKEAFELLKTNIVLNPVKVVTEILQKYVRDTEGFTWKKTAPKYKTSAKAEIYIPSIDIVVASAEGNNIKIAKKRAARKAVNELKDPDVLEKIKAAVEELDKKKRLEEAQAKREEEEKAKREEEEKAKREEEEKAKRETEKIIDEEKENQVKNDENKNEIMIVV